MTVPAGQPMPATQPGVTITPVSSTPVGELTAAQRKSRYEDLRKRMNKPRLEVKGEPGIHYFWADKFDDAEMTRKEVLGYSIVREPNAKDVLAGKAKPKIQANGLREDGTYVIGDVILTQCDQDVYDFLMLDNDEKSSGALAAAKETFKSESHQSGIPTFEREK